MRWLRRSAADEDAATRLSAETRLPLPVARLLIARGIATPGEAHRFLVPEFSHLHSPYQMLGMRSAAGRMRAAIAGREKILIYGDYDVDGTLAVVILKTAIELCGGVCDFHVPHRVRDGYGMKDDVLERAAADGVRLIVSVDTGIRAFAAAETARRLGLDLIVTDHHLPTAEGVPPALAVLNPNQPGCLYPCKSLCGAAVAFKLAHAVMESAGLARLLPSFLKVVAIATIADAVPLTGENRVIAKLGLDGLRRATNPGLKALLEICEINGGRALTAGEVAFRLAPRLNAAGRMDVAREVVDLFSVRDAGQARQIAERLNRLNSERQQEEQRILEEIEARLAEDAALRESWCMVVDGEGWHKGVIGIAASRLLERYARPVLVIAREGEQAQGSARSIEAFPMLNALETCAPLFTRFGGHAHAAGFALPSSNISQLRDRLDAKAREWLQAADLEPSLRYDAELELREVTPELFAALVRMEPFGMGNPEPVFVARQLRIVGPPRLLKEKHFKIRVRQIGAPAKVQQSASPGDSETAALPRAVGPRVFDALAWRLADRLGQQPLAGNDLVDLAFCVVQNSHPEFGGLELSICDYARTEQLAAKA